MEKSVDEYCGRKQFRMKSHVGKFNSNEPFSRVFNILASYCPSLRLKGSFERFM